MADFGALKKSKTGIAAPPPPEAAGDNTRAPETAPASPPLINRVAAPRVPVVGVPKPTEPARRDGRSLRKTGRTHQFATRIKAETHERMYDIAEREGITLGELIERAVEAYEQSALR